MENKQIYTVSFDSVRYTVTVGSVSFYFTHVESVLDFLNSNRYTFVRNRRKSDFDFDGEIESIKSFLKENYKDIKNHNNC